MSNLPFIVRVYGIYIHPEKGLLVSDEHIFKQNITKFPGGGLQFGEGTIDCLKREMLEESGHEFDVISHFYTTDFFVESAFDSTKQVISIYYLMKPVKSFDVKIASGQFEFEKIVNGAQSLRYISPDKLKRDDFTLVIDKLVGGMLSDRFLKGEIF